MRASRLKVMHVALLGSLPLLWSTPAWSQSTEWLGLPGEDVFLVEVDYPRSAVQLGQGWDSLGNRKTMANCVIGVEAPILGATVKTVYQDVYDREQLATSLAASAGGSYGPFSGSASYSRSVNIDRSRRNLMATSYVDTGGKQLAPPTTDAQSDTTLRLSKGALKILTEAGTPIDKRLARFRQVCGDAFVVAVREGGRLQMMFNALHSATTVEESVKASASAKFGAGGASGSISSTTRTELTKDTTAFDGYEMGGSLTVPGKADEALKKVTDFGPEVVKANTKSPYSLVIASYRSLPDFRPEWHSASVSLWWLKVMQGQAARVGELARLYADAAIKPTDYYFPYLPGNEAAASRQSEVLFAASTCLRGLLAYCASGKPCDYQALQKLDGPQIQRMCPTFDKVLGPAQRVQAAMLAFPADVAKKYIESVPELAAASASAMSAKPAKIASSTIGLTSMAGKDAGIDQFLLQRSVASLAAANPESATSPPTGFAQLYYVALAQAPLQRRPKTPTAPGDRSPADESLHVEWFCSASGLACGPIQWAALSADKKNGDAVARDATAKAIYDAWIVGFRIGPVASAFCAEASIHPMCLAPGQVVELVKGYPASFGPAARFHPNPPPPAAPVPPRYREPPCTRGRVMCPPV